MAEINNVTRYQHCIYDNYAELALHAEKMSLDRWELFHVNAATLFSSRNPVIHALYRKGEIVNNRQANRIRTQALAKAKGEDHA